MKCACGLNMQDNGRGAMYCDNCDSVQPQEAVGMARRKTQQDIRFDMYWLREEEKYENNVGTPNTEPEGGTTNE